MSSQEKLDTAFEMLNNEQRQAVETLDGPVLVVAGPGTGKTQLLSLRVVNILQNRDVSPENILCLTFTDAGAEAMTKRLSGFIGRDAYAVQISTFHSFAAHLRSYYPEYFDRSVFDRQITDLQAKKLVNNLLMELKVTDPLYQNLRPLDPVVGSLGDVFSLIGALERSSLKPEQMHAIVRQNEAYFDYVKQNTELLEALEAGISKDKISYVEGIREEINRIASALPPEIKEPVVELPGSYTPYGTFLAQRFDETELYEEQGKRINTKGFQALRDTYFTKKPRDFVDRAVNAKMGSAIAVFARYRAYMYEQGLYDFQDIINDAIKAVAEHPTFQNELQERYQYILVDEFQDTNGSQMELIDLLTEGIENPNVLAVGDDDQAIMRFQGASVAYINQFEQHYDCGVKRIVLKTNYRSTPSLVELGQQVAKQIENRSSASQYEKKLAAYKEDDEQTTFFAQIYPTKELEYYAVASDIAQLVQDGFLAESEKPEEAIAVIAAAHKNLRALIPYLHMLKVPFNYKITNAVSEIASLQTMLALMHFVVQFTSGDVKRANVYLPQIIAAKEIAAYFKLKDHDALMFAVEARKEKRGWFKALESSENARLQKLHVWLIEMCREALSAPVRQVLFDLSVPLRRYYEIAQECPDKEAKNKNLFEMLEFNYGLKALIEFVSEEAESRQAVGASAQPLRLADLSVVLNDAASFKVDIKVDIPVGKENAITLTSAHSSKGLEYDLVYILDADDKSWHYGGKSSSVATKNLLFGNTKDEDDHRRLLFVALTRAKTYLKLAQARSAIVRELVDNEKIEVIEPELTLDEQVTVAEESWADSYKPDQITLKELAAQALAGSSLSATMLNDFVTYPGDDFSGEPFLLKQVLRIPEEPSIYLDFGNIVHSFFEDYVNKVVKTQSITAEELTALTHKSIDYLDFEQTLVEHRHQFFDQIVNTFVPTLNEMLTEDPRVEQWLKAEVNGISIHGKIDLLLLDNAEKTVKVYDYKTGKAHDKKPDARHLRQLRFYKLLIENSSEYEGWKVLGGADLYVMPQKDLNNELAEIRFLAVSDDEVEHVCSLAEAVWYRLQNGHFDTSAFLESEQYMLLCEKNEDNGEVKQPKKDDLQVAYEQWLIEEYRSAAYNR